MGIFEQGVAALPRQRLSSLLDWRLCGAGLVGSHHSVGDEHWGSGAPTGTGFVEIFSTMAPLRRWTRPGPSSGDLIQGVAALPRQRLRILDWRRRRWTRREPSQRGDSSIRGSAPTGTGLSRSSPTQTPCGAGLIGSIAWGSFGVEHLGSGFVKIFSTSLLAAWTRREPSRVGRFEQWG